MPFGLRNAPASFVKAIRKVLFPIREHSDAYVDDTYTTVSYTHLTLPTILRV